MCSRFRTTNFRWMTSIIIVCAICLISEHGVTPGLAEIPSPKINVELQGGLLSVQVENVALADVLNIIGEHANFSLILYSDFQTPISQSFSNVLLQEGIRRLAKDHSVVILYQTVTTPGNGGVRQDIAEVYVFNTGESLQTISFDNDDLAKTAKQQEKMPIEYSHPSQQNSREVTQDLNKFSEESEVGHWVRVLAQYQDRTIRERAITELKWIGSDEAITAIATALGDQDDILRCYAVESIGSITSDLSTQLLGQVLIGDPDAEVRMVAVRLFAERLNEQSRAFLNTALKDSDIMIRTLAKQALATHNQ